MSRLQASIYRLAVIIILGLGLLFAGSVSSSASDQLVEQRKARLADLLAAVPPRVTLSDADIQRVADRMMVFSTSLAPGFFEGDTLRPDLRAKAMAFAQARFDDLRLPNLKILDMLYVGSLASYEYDALSDVDVHIIIDPASFAGDPAMLRRYLNTVNDLNEFIFYDVTIFGRKADYSFYADSVARRIEPGVGVYSLFENKWLSKPIPAPVRFSKDSVYTDLLAYVRRYNDLVDAYAADKNRFQCERFSQLREDIRLYRRKGIARDGIRSTENIVYRATRRINGNLLNQMEKLQRQCDAIHSSL
jgi:hypothetical protein